MREIAGKRPAYGTGEPGKQRDASDGTPSMAVIRVRRGIVSVL